MMDITHDKAPRRPLRTSEERFPTLAQFSFDVYWETDAQHRFTLSTSPMRRQEARRSARRAGRCHRCGLTH
jgi:hypothetical protein